MPFAFAGSLVQSQATKSAAGTSAAAQLESARIAAEAAKFRPVGVTTRYGSSNFQTDDQGNLIGAGYNISPELRAYQDQLLGLTGRQLQQGLKAPEQYDPLTGAATGLFNLGSQYLSQSPQEAAQKYIEQQQNLLAPSRERQYALLQNNLFQTGRGGLSVGGTGLRPGGGLGLSATNPELEAYYNALAQQDAQLAAQAEEAGQRRTAYGAGLFGTGAGLLGQYQAGQTGALSPFQTSLGLGGTIEQMGQTPLDISAALAGRSASAGANAGRFLLEGGLGAAKTMQPANALSPLATALSSVSGSDFGKQTNQYLQGQIKNWWESPSTSSNISAGNAFMSGSDYSV
jgi:hypothetical protein